jgi:hypothetical protein
VQLEPLAQLTKQPCCPGPGYPLPVLASPRPTQANTRQTSLCCLFALCRLMATRLPVPAPQTTSTTTTPTATARTQRVGPVYCQLAHCGECTGLAGMQEASLGLSRATKT